MDRPTEEEWNATDDHGNFTCPARVALDAVSSMQQQLGDLIDLHKILRSEFKTLKDQTPTIHALAEAKERLEVELGQTIALLKAAHEHIDLQAEVVQRHQREFCEMAEANANLLNEYEAAKAQLVELTNKETHVPA